MPVDAGAVERSPDPAASEVDPISIDTLESIVIETGLVMIVFGSALAPAADGGVLVMV